MVRSAPFETKWMEFVPFPKPISKMFPFEPVKSAKKGIWGTTKYFLDDLIF